MLYILQIQSKLLKSNYWGWGLAVWPLSSVIIATITIITITITIMFSTNTTTNMNSMKSIIIIMVSFFVYAQSAY